MWESLRSKAKLLLEADRANIDVDVDAVNKLSKKLQRGYFNKRDLYNLESN